MNMWQKIAAAVDKFLFPEPEETPPESPEGLCGNCWGHYEYGNQIREVARDRRIDVRNKKARQTFIQEFVETNVDGIRLTKTDAGYLCQACGKTSPHNH